MIFDLDGVIVDSEIWWDDVRKAFAANHGRTWTTDDRASVMGANSAAWARTMRDRLSLDLAPDVIDGLVAETVEHAVRVHAEGEASARLADGSALPRLELPDLVDGVDLGSLYELAALLVDAGVAVRASGGTAT